MSRHPAAARVLGSLLALALAPVACCTEPGTIRGPGDTEDSSPAAVLGVDPGAVVLQPGEGLTLEVTGVPLAEVTFSSSAPSVATVDAGGRVEAVAWGEAVVTVSWSTQSIQVSVTVAEEEVRGFWVTRWTYSSSADVDRIMDDCASANANTVYFQVRGRFDAFYDSDLEPWAAELSGDLGADPGWDPLAYAVGEAHQRGLELHAYLNTFPLWSGTTPPASAGVPHAYTSHPEWAVADSDGVPMPLNSSYVFASPGNPEVRAHVLAVVSDVASRYEVDGIHFDYVRYPGAEYSHDAASLAAWGGDGDYGDWQRQQVVDTLLAARQLTDLTLSAAVWGIYENSWGWSSVSEGNIAYYQDSRAFLSEGALDANLPMVYWPVTATPGERLDFRTLVQDHVDHASGRHVYAGVSATNLSWSQVAECIAVSKEVGAQGAVLFDYKAVRDNGWLDDLAAGPWAAPSVVPERTWR